MSSQAVPYRPIASAKRDDLQIVRHHVRGQVCFVVEDPLVMEYHRLNEQEMALLDWMDGQRSANDIQRLFGQTFAPHQVTFPEIERYLIQFSKKGLLQSSNSDVGGHLERRATKKRIQKTIASLKGILSIRIRGINPDRILGFLTPRMGWYFSPAMVSINAVWMIMALLLLGLNFAEFQARLPQQFEFFSPRNWIGIALVVMVTKLLHELGHGIVATKYGSRCHELGVMWMVFVPTLYVNASGSWKLADKWKRAAIGAAGIYVELSLAAMATFVWWYSRPGVTQYTALNVMATCSLSALVLNANPLMKFDGYYILSDLWELPNLQQRSGQYLRDRLMDWITGGRGANRLEPESTAQTKRLLLGYAIASYLFRFFVVYGIAFVLVGTLGAIGLEFVGKLLACFMLVMLLLKPILLVAQYLRDPGSWLHIESHRLTTFGIGVVVVSIAFFAVPLPHTLLCEGYVEPAGLTAVYAPRSGTIEETFHFPGQYVRRGEPILRLQDLDLALEIERTRGEISELEKQLQVIRRFDEGNASEMRSRLEIQSRVQELSTVLTELKESQGMLTIRAPRSGRIFADWIEQPEGSDRQQLGGRMGWSLGGKPGIAPCRERMLAGEGVHLQRGELVCRIGEPAKLQAKLMISQHEVETIQPGQKVEFRLVSDSGRRLWGRIESVSKTNVDQVARSMTLRHGGSVESAGAQPAQGSFFNDGKSDIPSEATYQATVVFHEIRSSTALGYQGSGKVRQPPKSMFSRVSSSISRAFRFNVSAS